MPQLNIYVPEELAGSLRQAARRSRLSLSQFVTGIIKEKLGPKGWRKDFFTRVVGGWKGSFPEISRPPPGKRVGP
jgi:hypothetical protein